MKNKLAVLLLFLLLLTGCSLAQPETENPAAERFVGFYVVPVSRDTWDQNPALTDYGSWTADTEYGKISIPKQILAAEKQDGQYTFPGLEGYSLFLLTGTNADGSIYSEAVSDMAPSEEGMQVHQTDGGTSNLISGVIYTGPPEGAGPDWDQYQEHTYFTAYRVYQAPNGMVYLDGSGSRFAEGGSYFETQSHTVTENGKTSADSLEVKVTVKNTPRLEHLIVTQFDAQNTSLSSEDLALREDLPEIRCLPETAWLLVEEQSAEGTVRTVYNKPESGEEPVYHTVVLLDDSGMGYTADLQIFR